MKKDLGKICSVFPMPVLMVAAYDENGKVNVMNAAWGMNSAMDKITLFIGERHKTTANIRVSNAFTVAIADRAHVVEADYVGIASGNDVPDKFERTGLHAVKSAHVNAPIIEEFPLTFECELEQIIDTDTYHAVVGNVVNLCADEKVIGENGKVDPLKVDAILFDQFQAGYYTIGEKVGQAWSSGKELMK
ncbi:MAG: flavin reductase family protein [Ruminococcaceae bacterium]|nr:flavin reductase family protein [Oscillospiraceae bacterium]